MAVQSESRALLGNEIQIVEIGQSHDARFTKCPRCIEYARSARFMNTVIKIVTYEGDAAVDAPFRPSECRYGARSRQLLNM
jgi:hypothetical protein